jgi:hypothetical protein
MGRRRRGRESAVRNHVPFGESDRYRAGQPAPHPLPLRVEEEVVAGWTGDQPVVSILCPTYQHVRFIEDALKGFLGQDTDFPFEVLVRDDASTDGTADIVRDYAQRYPRIIRAVLEPVNTWPSVRPYLILRQLARGEFIALCEGDDYWIEPLKLQRQVDALRRRPDAVLAHHERVVTQDGVITDEARRFPLDARDWSASELGRHREPVTAAVVFRNVDVHLGSYPGNITYGDNFLWLRLARFGGAVFVPELTASVYRVHDGGLHSGVPPAERVPRSVESWYWMAVWFAEQGDESEARYCAMRSIDTLATGLKRSGVGGVGGAGVHLLRQKLLESVRRRTGDSRSLEVALKQWGRYRRRTRGW